ncbi:hypothetical protein CANCADRAFT_144273 [Tortispora caseinolytica NRRL Y-17796]|uniref:Ferrochelatase n=1 Tax=Tortispora caseinolytica NRRL Y-17796 TaxID=767744 RepID=A0A1E4TDF8_9ASCO|nr:hypothetical protein CANCADRAFT_144273 [Tortispora caseinolytica NRRL Y-17796]
MLRSCRVSISFNQARKYSQGKGTALVLLNMGGPSSTKEVYSFLYNLFADETLIPLKQSLFPFLPKFIARRRTPMIQKQYEEIGGGSPIRRWNEFQASKACELLDDISPETAPHKPYIMFRYADPLTQDTLAQMLKDGVTRAVALSMYPQYSESTVGSSLSLLASESKKQDPNGTIKWSAIDRWPTHKGLTTAFAKLIREKLTEYPEEVRDQVIIMFSAHSLPMSVVNRGDPYPAEVAATVSQVMSELNYSNPYRLTWQSQVGPAPWLGAQTAKAVDGYLEQGYKNIMLVPIAFTSDHIETLYELDKEIIGTKNEPGLKRAQSLNGDPDFIKGMADLVAEHLKSNQKFSSQFLLPSPINKYPEFQSTRKFFLNQ